LARVLSTLDTVLKFSDHRLRTVRGRGPFGIQSRTNDVVDLDGPWDFGLEVSRAILRGYCIHPAT